MRHRVMMAGVDVHVWAQHDGGKLKIDFPHGPKAEVSAFMERALKQRLESSR
jgi:hypothetical protein